jgi:GTPase SAR1 family protein
MLRQIHIFKKKKRVFTHIFALALGNEEFQEIFDAMVSNTQIGKKTLHRALSGYQVFYRALDDYKFIIITDQIDKEEYIEDIFDKLVKKFKEIYPDNEILNESESKKEEFINYLYQLQADIHSKISIIGPVNAGKTTLYNILTDQQKERNIMNFAKASILSLYELKFDVWDFQINDNYALLWSKFISGSDLIIFIFDISNYNLKILNHFLNLKQKESNLSKFISIANKTDLVHVESTLTTLENELHIPDLIPLSLKNSDAKGKIFAEISKKLKIKKELPDNYDTLLKEAEEIEEEKNLGKAIAKYKELIRYLKRYQDFSEISKLEKKVEELETKLREQAEIRRKIELKKKFAPPTQIKFNKKITVKPLSKNNSNESEPLISTQSVESKEQKQATKSTLSSSDIEVDVSDLKKTEEKIPTEKKTNETLPESKFKSIDDVPDKAVLLQKMIESRGSKLSLKLCSQFIKEMMESLEREINLNDLKIAAENFIRLEKQ